MKRCAVLLAALLSACAGVPAPYGPPNKAVWRQRLDVLHDLKDWRMRGRIALSGSGRGGSGSLLWIEHSPQLDLYFSGPLGVGVFRAHGTPEHLLIDTGKGQQLETADAQRLFARRLGWPVPLAKLRYWVLGMPAPGPADIELDQHGLLRRLQQDGWDIRYREYASGDKLSLPRRIDAQRDGVKLKLAISQWNASLAAN